MDVYLLLGRFDESPSRNHAIGVFATKELALEAMTLLQSVQGVPPFLSVMNYSVQISLPATKDELVSMFDAYWGIVYDHKVIEGMVAFGRPGETEGKNAER